MRKPQICGVCVKANQILPCGFNRTAINWIDGQFMLKTHKLYAIELYLFSPRQVFGFKLDLELNGILTRQ